MRSIAKVTQSPLSFHVGKETRREAFPVTANHLGVKVADFP